MVSQAALGHIPPCSAYRHRTCGPFTVSPTTKKLYLLRACELCIWSSWVRNRLLQGGDCAWCVSQVRNIRKVLREIDKPFGLYPNFLSPVSGNWVQRKYWPLWLLTP